MGRADLYDAPLRDRSRVSHAGPGRPYRKARRRRRGVHDHGGSGARGANAYGIHPMLKRIPPDAVAHDAAIDWVARAREVAPLLTEAADRMERDRALTPEVLAALYDRE